MTWSEFDVRSFTLLSGTPSSYESRPKVTREFCGRCGTQLIYRHADDPGTIDITTCSLDSPERVSPQDHVWCDRMIPWLRIADGLPRYGLRRLDS